jgi:serine/threonine-protein kinase
VNTTTDGDDRVADAVAEYLEARDAGRPIAPADWLARHPDLTADLSAFLDEADGVAGALRSFRGCAREPDLRTDERFVGDYELVERVGGNMGVVYRARQLSLPREVAVKLLLRAGAAHRERFQTEAEAMARLHHPHVAPILEVCRGEGLPFFSMEWCPGGTLAHRAAGYGTQPDRAAELVGLVARAVHHAHQRGVLHRDLKPANILFDEFGQPRVADFGLAVSLGDEASAGAGTPAYMAPEQLTGEVTVATDVYGLGAVLYELLTGRAPSAADTLTRILERVRTADPVPPARLNPRVDPDLDAVCRKCLAKDPARRYASAVELADDLDRYRQGLPTAARPLGPLGRVAHVVRQARQAAEFRAMGPGLVAQAVFVLATNAAVFGLLRAGAAEGWVWAALFASYVPLFLLLAWQRWSATRRRYNPGQTHLWAVWAGHATACAAVFVANRAAADDLGRAIGTGYIGCAGVNALAFIIMGSLFAGRHYLLGFGWAVAAVAMGAFLPWAPLIYALLMAACSLLTGLQLSAIASDAETPEGK